MGDLVSSDHEWIELYNDGDPSLNLSGWKLVATDSSDDTKEKFSISLTGDILAKGYFLIEKKHSASDAAPYLASDFTAISFSLVNTGETLRLKNADGTKIDEVISPFKTKWEKGDNVTKETMQRNGTAWVTAEATPRAQNKTVDTTINETTGDTTPDTPDDTTSSHSSTLDTSAHVSPLPLSSFSQKQELYISAGRDRIAAAGSPVLFETYAIDAKGVRSQNISSVWSFGDGGQAGGMKVTHTYKYPGDYAVVLNASAGGNEAVSRAEVRVFAPKIVLTAEADGSITLSNDSAYEINIGGWKVAGTGGNFIFPSDTIVKTGKQISISKMISRIDLSASGSIKLSSPDGVMVASYSKTAKPIISVVSTTPAEIPAVEKEIETNIIETNAPLIVVPQPKIQEQKQMQTAAAAFAISEKEKPEEKTPVQTIVLKKPEGFFAKIWNFLFR